jgi:hypothetical protein
MAPIARGSRKLIVVAAALALLVGAYAAAGFWLVPKILRSKAESFVSENYGRKLTLGEIRFNPFTLGLEVDGLSLPDADGEPLANFDSLVVNLGISSLWRRGASFEEILIAGPYVRRAGSSISPTS